MHAKLLRWQRLVFSLILTVAVSAGGGRGAHAQIVVGDSNVGYIDTAVLATQIRVRFDAAYSSQFADRAEFVYAQYGVAGAPRLERGIDSHQELAAYLEWQASENLSLFADVPVRWINPVVNDNTSGLYDVQAGMKAALLKDEQSLLTAQLRGYFPTGDASSGLSTKHVSLEPALLGLFKASPRAVVETELRLWVPIGGSTAPAIGGSGPPREFTDEILRYGLGLGYRAFQGERAEVIPVAELVGWHLFGGLHSLPTGQRVSSTNDAITNIKLGMRFLMKPGRRDAGPSHSLFVGYGRVLTSANWYSDILRFEFRRSF